MKHETEMLMAERFYGYYPNHRKLNNAIWSFFEKENYLWLSNVKDIAKEEKIDLRIFLTYLELLVEGDNNPALLRQNFYQLNSDGELQLIPLGLEQVISELEASPKPANPSEMAFMDWAKTVFTLLATNLSKPSCSFASC